MKMLSSGIEFVVPKKYLKEQFPHRGLFVGFDALVRYPSMMPPSYRSYVASDHLWIKVRRAPIGEILMFRAMGRSWIEKQPFDSSLGLRRVSIDLPKGIEEGIRYKAYFVRLNNGDITTLNCDTNGKGKVVHKCFLTFGVNRSYWIDVLFPASELAGWRTVRKKVTKLAEEWRLN